MVKLIAIAKIPNCLRFQQVEGYSDEELLTIMGLFDMYGYPIGPTGAKAFHLSPCFMKSSCKPNTYSMILSDYSIIYKASVKIKKGESIIRCYGDVTKCTYFRSVTAFIKQRVRVLQMQQLAKVIHYHKV